ncbi:MAG: hypothetical protein AB1916_16160 [Thermodesulfobacteriota bacterium]
MKKTNGCPCVTAIIPKEGNELEEFAVLRKQCPVLKYLLIPDGFWSDYQKRGPGLLCDVDRSFVYGAFLEPVPRMAKRQFLRESEFSGIIPVNSM